MIFGAWTMQKLHVDNLDTCTLFELFQAPRSRMEPDQYGWVILAAPEVNVAWAIVIMADGKFITAAIMKMPALNVHQ